MNLNIKNYGVADWLKLAANVLAAAAAGYAMNGYAGMAVNGLGALITLLQAPPGHDTLPK